MYDMIDHPIRLSEAADAKDLPNGPGEVRFQDVTFGYEDGAHPANSFRTSRAAIDDGVVNWVDD